MSPPHLSHPGLSVAGGMLRPGSPNLGAALRVAPGMEWRDTPDADGHIRCPGWMGLKKQSTQGWGWGPTGLHLRAGHPASAQTQCRHRDLRLFSGAAVHRPSPHVPSCLPRGLQGLSLRTARRCCLLPPLPPPRPASPPPPPRAGRGPPFPSGSHCSALPSRLEAQSQLRGPAFSRNRLIPQESEHHSLPSRRPSACMEGPGRRWARRAPQALCGAEALVRPGPIPTGSFLPILNKTTYIDQNGCLGAAANPAPSLRASHFLCVTLVREGAGGAQEAAGERRVGKISAPWPSTRAHTRQTRQTLRCTRTAVAQPGSRGVRPPRPRGAVLGLPSRLGAQGGRLGCSRRAAVGPDPRNGKGRGTETLVLPGPCPQIRVRSWGGRELGKARVTGWADSR